MAITWAKRRLEFIWPDQSYLEMCERDLPEGTSETFYEHSPLSLSSGLYVAFVNPTTAKIAAFTLEAGHNGTGKTTHGFLPTDDLEIEGNFLASGGANNVLAAADRGLSRDLLSLSTLINGDAGGWYIADAAADAGAQVVDFRSQIPPPNVEQSQPAVGDTNARVRARILSTAKLW